MRRLAALASTLTLAAGLTACGDTAGTEEPVDSGAATGQDGQVPTASRDEAAALVHDRVTAVVGLLDAPVENPYLGPAPCEDPAGDLSREGVYYMSAKQQVVVGEGGVAEALRAVHGHFVRQGFDTEEIRWLADGTGSLRALDQDGYRYSLLPTEPPVALAFFVDSPCFRAPEGEDPMDGQWLPPQQ